MAAVITSASALSATTEQAAQQQQTTGVAQAATAGGAVLGKETYLRKVTAILAHHKRYPMQARRRSEEGTVVGAFTVLRSGDVLDILITQSSGSQRLDKAVLDMVQRVSPLPPFPVELLEPQLALRIPVTFNLQDRH